MRLYLVQHGRAHPKEADPDRHLTEQGAEEVKRTAAFLRPLHLQMRAIWHSGKARSLETAEILAPVLHTSEPVTLHEGLAPNDPVKPVRKEVSAAREDLLIVGHLPFLARLAAALLVRDEEAEIVAFQMGGVVCLERDEDDAWRLCWAVVPELLDSEQ